MTSTAPIIARVRKGMNYTAHLAVSRETFYGAQLFESTVCGRPIEHGADWTDVPTLSDPWARMAQDTIMTSCQRCAARMGKTVAADYVAAQAEDAYRAQTSPDAAQAEIELREARGDSLPAWLIARAGERDDVAPVVEIIRDDADATVYGVSVPGTITGDPMLREAREAHRVAVGGRYVDGELIVVDHAPSPSWTLVSRKRGGRFYRPVANVPAGLDWHAAEALAGRMAHSSDVQVWYVPASTPHAEDRDNVLEDNGRRVPIRWDSEPQVAAPALSLPDWILSGPSWHIVTGRLADGSWSALCGDFPSADGESDTRPPFLALCLDCVVRDQPASMPAWEAGEDTSPTMPAWEAELYGEFVPCEEPCDDSRCLDARNAPPAVRPIADVAPVVYDYRDALDGSPARHAVILIGGTDSERAYDTVSGTPSAEWNAYGVQGSADTYCGRVAYGVIYTNGQGPGVSCVDCLAVSAAGQGSHESHVAALTAEREAAQLADDEACEQDATDQRAREAQSGRVWVPEDADQPRGWGTFVDVDRLTDAQHARASWSASELPNGVTDWQTARLAVAYRAPVVPMTANAIGHRTDVGTLSEPIIVRLGDGRHAVVRYARFSPRFTTLVYTAGPSDTYAHDALVDVATIPGEASASRDAIGPRVLSPDEARGAR